MQVKRIPSLRILSKALNPTGIKVIHWLCLVILTRKYSVGFAPLTTKQCVESVSVVPLVNL